MYWLNWVKMERTVEEKAEMKNDRMTKQVP